MVVLKATSSLSPPAAPCPGRRGRIDQWITHACFLKALGDRRLNWAIVTRAHAPRRTASRDLSGFFTWRSRCSSSFCPRRKPLVPPYSLHTAY